MKKFVLILLLLLTACTAKEDYYTLNIDDYSLTVGYSDAKYMSIAFEYELPSEIEAKQTIKDVDIRLNGELLGVAEFTNYKKKPISSDKAILTRIELYVNDLPGRTFKLNNEVLDSSIKNICDKYEGTYIEKNGYACIIENQIKDKLNVVELHGDYLNMDQDALDRIIIYIQ